mmetsp:Transcript_29247/g.41399  ORF Transcript_29247/g.41399 Transcript_29247/m.41399 type:complete len:283 (+) Transcript_29247:398-1246(+)
MGKWNEIPVRVHYTFVLLLLIQVFEANLRFSEPRFTLLMYVVYGPVMFFTVLIHEFGHIWMARRLGGTVEDIVLWPLGGFTMTGATTGGPIEDLWIAVAGPLTNVLQGSFWLSLYTLSENGDFAIFSNSISLESLRDGGPGEFISLLSVQATVLNTALFIMNLAIPGYPLDGGRCLADFLIIVGFETQTAGRITALVGMLSGFLMLFMGVYLYISDKSGAGLFLAIVAAFVISAATELLKLVNMGTTYEHPLFRRDEVLRQSSLTPAGSDSDLTVADTAEVV